MKRLASVAFVLVLAGLLVCGCPPGMFPRVRVSPTNATVQVGDTAQFTAASSDPDDTVFSWQTSNPAVATVNPAGLVTGAGVGSAMVSATGNHSGRNGTATVSVTAPPPQTIDLSAATVVQRPGTLPNSEAKAAEILLDEVEKRTSLSWTTTSTWPASGPVIAMCAGPGDPGWGVTVPRRAGTGLPEQQPEGYRVYVDTSKASGPVVWILGADARGVLYGAGKFLRAMAWGTGTLKFPRTMDYAVAPDQPLRGHQIGYRDLANSYDKWDVAQYEQYVRELVIFGANAIENIPFEDAGASVHFPVTPEAMNAALSQICDDYGIEYWVWTPAQVDLSNPTAYAGLLARHELLYQACVRLDGVFVPGGDPGSNPPGLVMAFLEEAAAVLATHHPPAGMWVSNQGFTPAENDSFFNYLTTQDPDWLAGVVFGPWTKISLAQERARTPSRYPIRRYPDITHNVRCQYPMPDWDRAYAHTLGREAPNPRPADQVHIHNVFAHHADGFLTYSDGAHDDLNKMVWSMCGFDASVSVEDMLEDYCRFFFGPNVAEDAAAGIAALEDNWRGPLASNSSVADTLRAWQALESAAPGLAGNWRWELCLLRAYYDEYLRQRLVYENHLEEQANLVLEKAVSLGADTAMNQAEAILNKAVTEPRAEALRTRIIELCEALFASMGLQTSTAAPYFGKNPERGCVLEFIDWPLNNRYWLESYFDEIRGYASEVDKLVAIRQYIVDWEKPGPGGFYDNLGRLGQQPHLVQALPWASDPGCVLSAQNGVNWHSANTTDWEKGAGRLSWQSSGTTLFGTPLRMAYTGLDPAAPYRLRVLYWGRFKPAMTLTADGTQVLDAAISTAPLQFPPVEYVLPASLTADGALELQWDLVDGRGCQVAEVWLERTDVK